MRKKYSDNFNRDFNWYLKVRHLFTFDGKAYIEPKFSNKGVSGKEAFYLYDCQGTRIVATKHPNIFRILFKVKSSVNLHIKMYAEDRAKEILPDTLFEELCKEINAPEWFIKAVENQKKKYL